MAPPHKRARACYELSLAAALDGLGEQTPCPTVARPKQLACFSLAADGTVHLDDRALREFAQPALGADLGQCFEAFVDKDRSAGPATLHAPLRALADRSASGAPPQRAHVVSWRGNVTKLLCTPFSRDAWEMALTVPARRGARGEGVAQTPVLLDVRETAAELDRLRARDERMRRLAYCGYRFEQLCTAAAADESAAAAPPDPRVAYCTVNAVSIGPHRLVLAAEVDAVVGPLSAARAAAAEGRAPDYVELKVSAVHAESARAAHSYRRHKLLKFWAQSFSVGVERVVVGLRDEGLRLRALESLHTLAIPRQVRGVPGMWQPALCLTFAVRALEWALGAVVATPAAAAAVRVPEGGADAGRGRAARGSERPPDASPCCAGAEEEDGDGGGSITWLLVYDGGATLRLERSEALQGQRVPAALLAQAVVGAE